MDLKQANYFLQIIDSGGFSAAADELFISQSSLSKQIMALEKELGAALFQRGKRKITLTSAGSAFLPHARALSIANQHMLAALAPYQTSPNLSIIAIPVIAQYKIAAFIASYKHAHPETQLVLEEHEAGGILPALDERRFDIAFVRDNTLDQTRYAFIAVTHDRFLAALPRQHRLAGRESIALAELADENFIMFDKGTVVHELAMDACRAAGFEPHIFYASLRVESILGMVSSGSGVALIMQQVFAYHQHPDTVGIPLQEQITSNLVLAWRKDAKLSKEAAEFIECTKTSFGGAHS